MYIPKIAYEFNWIKRHCSQLPFKLLFYSPYLYINGPRSSYIFWHETSYYHSLSIHNICSVNTDGLNKLCAYINCDSFNLPYEEWQSIYFWGVWVRSGFLALATALKTVWSACGNIIQLIWLHQIQHEMPLDLHII